MLNVYSSLQTKVFSKGSAAEALAASMAVPILFKPVWSKGRPLLDGAVGDVAGVDGLDRSERVLYHHVSSRCAAATTATRISVVVYHSAAAKTGPFLVFLRQAVSVYYYLTCTAVKIIY